jgi:hypothetical protein
MPALALDSSPSRGILSKLAELRPNCSEGVERSHPGSDLRILEGERGVGVREFVSDLANKIGVRAHVGRVQSTRRP